MAGIHCVSHHPHQRLRGVLDKVEDWAVEKSQPGYFTPRAHSEPWYGKCPYPFSYNGKYDQVDHVDHLTSPGLGYMKGILETSMPSLEEPRTSR